MKNELSRLAFLAVTAALLACGCQPTDVEEPEQSSTSALQENGRKLSSWRPLTRADYCYYCNGAPKAFKDRIAHAYWNDADANHRVTIPNYDGEFVAVHQSAPIGQVVAAYTLGLLKFVGFDVYAKNYTTVGKVLDAANDLRGALEGANIVQIKARLMDFAATVTEVGLSGKDTFTRELVDLNGRTTGRFLMIADMVGDFADTMENSRRWIRESERLFVHPSGLHGRINENIFTVHLPGQPGSALDQFRIGWSAPPSRPKPYVP